MIPLIYLILLIFFIKYFIICFRWTYKIFYLYIIPKKSNPAIYGKWAGKVRFISYHRWFKWNRFGSFKKCILILIQFASQKVNIVIIGNEKDSLENTKKLLGSQF